MIKRLASAAAVLLLTATPVAAYEGPATPRQVEPEARAIAESVIEAMGGQNAWDSTRHVAWKFFGGRQHYWDKHNGDIRIEIPANDRGPEMLILMNLDSRSGRVWTSGEELTGTPLQEGLERGWRSWVNDSYWMFMPYKLMDPGVNLRLVGEDIMADDREADVLEMTFENVGVTPDNRYLVYVARDSGLVEQWSYFAERDQSEPGFTMPWENWTRFGDILLSTSRGDDADWDIHVYDTLPGELYSDPDYTLEPSM